MIGPWSHTGLLDNRIGIKTSMRRSRFNHLTHAIGFFDRCCGRATDAQTIAELAKADDTNGSAGDTPHLTCLRSRTCSQSTLKTLQVTAGLARGSDPACLHADGPGAARAAGSGHGLARKNEPSLAAIPEGASGSNDSLSAAGEPSSEAVQDAGTPVHYFVMGPGAGWQSASAWPPPDLAPEPRRLLLGAAAGSRRALSAACRAPWAEVKTVMGISGILGRQSALTYASSATCTLLL